MSPGIARNWWAIGLRGFAAALFAACLLILPQPALASLVLLFTAYIAADGIFAIIAAIRAARSGERWRSLMAEGVTNLLVAAWVAIWPAIAVVPFVRLASAWAMVTGGLMIAAARRLALSHGRWLLALAGAESVSWGILVAAIGPSAESGTRVAELWLAVYALPFAVLLLALAFGMRRGHRVDVTKPARAS